MTDFLDNVLFSLPTPWPLAVVLSSMAVVAVLAFMGRSLDAGGAAFAYIMGVTVLWTTRFEGFLVFLLFFISCNAVGRLSRRIRKTGGPGEMEEKKGHRRDFMQVMSNGLMATIAALLWFFSSKYSALIMFGASIAEATSDTFAGEIGRLSRRGPVSILTLRPVPVGMSGGVTVLGLLAALGGSALIAMCWHLLFSDATFMGAALVCLLGFAGSVVDSYLGSAVQARYMDPTDGTLSEREVKEGRKLELSHGIRWVDNDMVNLLSNIFSSVFALGMGILIEFSGKS